MAKPQMTSKSAGPWWLGDGEEECPHCGQLYFLEVEVRCAECDGPSCPHCRVKHTEGFIVCPSCVEGGTHG